MGVIDRLIRTPHRRCDDAPAPATRVAPDRAQRPPKRWLYAATQESTAGGRSRGGCGATSRFATSQETDRSRLPQVNRFRLRHREDFAWVLRETRRLAR